MHPTIILTTDWPKTSVYFLDVMISVAEGIIETNLHVKLINSHQYLLLLSCHPFYCKKGIPYNQALKLNRICSNNEFIEEGYNDLEKYLLERTCSEEIVLKQILRARATPKDELLEKVNYQEKQNKITFNNLQSSSISAS